MKILMRSDLHGSIGSDPDILVVNRALLMNPNEVHKLTHKNTKDVKKIVRGSWTLGGTVSGDKFAELKAKLHTGLAHRMTIVTFNSGAVYVVIATQLGQWQHRFVLPTFVGKAVSLFAADSDKPLSLNFGATSDDDGFLFFKAVFPPDDYPEVLARSKRIREHQIPQLISEMSSVVMDLLHPSAVPSMSMTDEVREVEVSFLMPWACELDPYLQEEELEETT